MAMYLLFEAAHGYALFEVLQHNVHECMHWKAVDTAAGGWWSLVASTSACVPTVAGLLEGVLGRRPRLLQVKQADELAQGSAGATALASDLARFSKAIALTGFVPFSTAAQVHRYVCTDAVAKQVTVGASRLRRLMPASFGIKWWRLTGSSASFLELRGHQMATCSAVAAGHMIKAPLGSRLTAQLLALRVPRTHGVWIVRRRWMRRRPSRRAG